MYARTGGLLVLVLTAFLGNMIATVAFAATSVLWLAMLVGAAWGFTLTMMSTGTQALVQSSVDNAVRARVMSLYAMIYRGAPFIGALAIGWAADRIGLQLAFAIAALLCAVPWLATARRRAAMTMALEGRSNDLDERMMAAARAMAGNSVEAVKRQAQALRDSGIDDKAKASVRWAWERARQARLNERLQALLQRRGAGRD